MELLVLVLNQSEYLNEILEGFLHVGLSGATIIESTGMGRTLSENVPLFGGLSNIFQNSRPNNLTVFSVVENEEQRKRAVQVIEDILGNLNDPNTGIYFVIPVLSAGGFAEPIR